MTALALTAAAAADAVALSTCGLAPPSNAPRSAAAILRFAAASPMLTGEPGDEAVSRALLDEVGTGSSSRSATRQRLGAASDRLAIGCSSKVPEPRVAALRARALADVKRLRALARAARGDGLPQAALRAANASAAARSVLGHARRLCAPCPCPTDPRDAVAGAE